MSGTLYGVGVGPGDPELLTLKAARILNETRVWIVPGACPKETIAYQIASQAIKDLDGKQIVGVHMPMIKEKNRLLECHKKAAYTIIEYLEAGEDVAFLTLGDPCIYSTYIYVQQFVKEAGYSTVIINGIPSFLAVSACLGEGLVEKAEMLHIIPATYQIEEGMNLTGTKVLMKAGTKMGQVKAYLKEHQLNGKMVERCTMEGERIYKTTNEIPEDAGYYSLLIVKESGEKV